MKKVTQILCYYNEERYLEMAIQSILEQSYENIELIIIDDASTDGSAAIVNKFSDSRICHVQNKINHGLAWCRNQGLEIATGDYVGFVDADDIMLKDKVEKQVCFLEQNRDILVVSGNFACIDSENKILMDKMSNLELDDLAIRCKMLFANCIAGPCALFRREVIDVYNIRNNPEMRTSQDFYFWLKCLENGKICNMDEVLFYYRINHNSQSNQRRIKDQRRYDEILIEIYKYAWTSRGFDITEEDAVLIYNYLYQYKPMWKIGDVLHALKLYQIIDKQACGLSTSEREKIKEYYRERLYNCLLITVPIRVLKSYLDAFSNYFK